LIGVLLEEYIFKPTGANCSVFFKDFVQQKTCIITSLLIDSGLIAMMNGKHSCILILYEKNPND